MVAADYSQLELRLLAYLSGDPKLKEVLNCGQDVFCNLAATWNSIAPELVSEFSIIVRTVLHGKHGENNS